MEPWPLLSALCTHTRLSSFLRMCAQCEW
jgi:hypothetical protein